MGWMPKHDNFSNLPMMEGSSPYSKIDPGLVAYGVTRPAGYALGTKENKIFLCFNISGIILWFLTNVHVTRLTMDNTRNQQGFCQPCKRLTLGSLSNHEGDNDDVHTDWDENVIFDSKIKLEQRGCSRTTT